MSIGNQPEFDNLAQTSNSNLDPPREPVKEVSDTVDMLERLSDQASKSANENGSQPNSESASTKASTTESNSTNAGASSANKTGQSREIDPNLVRETKIQIRNLINEVNVLAQSDVSLEEFCDGFLPRVVSALGSVSGAIWMVDQDERITLKNQVQMAKSGLTNDEPAKTQHDLLLRRCIRKPEALIVQPASGSTDAAEPGNPTEQLLIIDTIMVGGKVAGIIEIFQRPGGGPATQRGYLRFLVQMGEIASSFFTNHQLRNFHSQQSLWDKLEKFIRDVHSGLDRRETLYTIANEGRRIIDCDRLTVASAKGNKTQIEVVSGLDSFDRRSEDIKNLGALTKAVCKTGNPLFYEGDSENLAPQIEKKLQQYVDRSHTKALSIVPLFESRQEDESSTSQSKQKPKLIGALISEQLTETEIRPATRNRIQVVAGHSGDAITNSLAHNQVFLLPVWRQIGKIKAGFSTGIPTWFVVLLTVAVGIFLLCVTPYNFTLPAEGKLTPQIQFHVFAPYGGLLSELYLPEDPDEFVKRNQVLAVITNDELQVEIQNLQGKLEENAQRIKKIERILNRDDGELTFQEQQIYEGEETELAESQNSTRRLLALKQQQKMQLTILSPTTGQVVNWQAEESLRRRPVKSGDNILTVVDPEGPWQVELEIQEKRIGYFWEATHKSDEPVKVTFVLASHPDREFSGTVIQIDQKTEVRSDQGNTMLVRVEFDRSKLRPEMLKEGTRVSARIECGEKTLAFVIFHDVIDTVRKKLLLWF